MSTSDGDSIKRGSVKRSHEEMDTTDQKCNDVYSHKQLKATVAKVCYWPPLSIIPANVTHLPEHLLVKQPVVQ